MWGSCICNIDKIRLAVFEICSGNDECDESVDGRTDGLTHKRVLGGTFDVYSVISNGINANISSFDCVSVVVG
jgi:hypothetical protein